MPLADISYVRLIGKLPDALQPENIDVHLESASRELFSWLGEYESTTDEEKIKACKEAEACICLAYLMPGMNTFYTDGAPGLQKELGEMDFLFHSPGDIKQLQETWMARARSRVLRYMSGAGGLKWEAI